VYFSITGVGRGGGIKARGSLTAAQHVLAVPDEVWCRVDGIERRAEHVGDVGKYRGEPRCPPACLADMWTSVMSAFRVGKSRVLGP